MAVTFVAGSTAVFSEYVNTISGNAPAGIANGDVLLAGVFGRAALNTPSGWTKIAETAQFVDEGGDFPQWLAVFRKDSVTAGDASASFSFTQAAGAYIERMGLAYLVFRGVDSIPQAVNNVTSNVDTWSITPSAATADADGSMLAAFAASCMASASSVTPTPPTSFTLTSGSALTAYRLAAAYRAVNNAQGNSGAFNMAPSIAAPSSEVGQKNGLGAIVIRLAPSSVANVNTYVQAASPLGAVALLAGVGQLASVAVASPLGAGRVAAAVDWHDQIEGMPVFSFMDLIMVDTSKVRVPISSWQATLQTDERCYLRCAVPDPEPYLDAINAAVAFAVSISTTARRDSYVVTKEIARAPVETVQSDQGATNHTAQISGYFDPYPTLPAQLAGFFRPQRGVRVISTQPDSQRLRCAFDWIMTPGNVATHSDGGGQLSVAYINTYMSGGDFYSDLGSRPA